MADPNSNRVGISSKIRGALLTWAHHPPQSSRHEVVMALAAASVMTSGGTLFGTDLRPASIIAIVPGWATKIWFVTLGIGGIALLVSGFKRDRLDALFIEGFAYFGLGVSSLLYAYCLLAVGNPTAFVAITSYAFYAIACLVRTIRIVLYMRFLNRMTARAT